jgi:O-antigen ligase
MKLLVSFGMLAVIVLLLMYSTVRGSKFLRQTNEELISGTVDYRDDANASFRFLAWAEAARRFVESPLVGEGFGVPFTFEDESVDVRPHNTFLTVIYKMGVMGFVPIVLLLTHLYFIGWRAIRRRRHHALSFLLYGFLLGHLSMSMFGMFNLLFESPFLGSVYWLSAGVAYRLVSLLESDPNVESAAA